VLVFKEAENLEINGHIEKHKASLFKIDLERRPVLNPVIHITGYRAILMTFTGVLRRFKIPIPIMMIINLVISLSFYILSSFPVKNNTNHLETTIPEAAWKLFRMNLIRIKSNKLTS
jgi:hypothetical protein